MNVVAIIPARSGSKRLPNKNILSLAGRPMLAYSTMLAATSKLISRTVITSDSQEYLNIGKEWGADIEIGRPPSLASDTSPILKTLQFVLSILEGELDPPILESYVDWIVLLQPNCPLRWQDDMERLIDVIPSEYDGALTVDTGAYKLGTIKPGKWFKPQYKPGARKQDMPIQYRENGVLYILKAANLRRGKLFGKKILLDEDQPHEQSLANIDTDFDYRLAQHLYQEYGYEEQFSQLEKQIKEKK